MASTLASIFTLAPVAMYVFLKVNLNELHLEKFKSRVGTLYNGLEMDGTMTPLVYNVIFISRRLAYCALILCLSFYSFL
jgi:hypothetical protein